MVDYRSLTYVNVTYVELTVAIELDRVSSSLLTGSLCQLELPLILDSSFSLFTIYIINHY